MSTAYRLWIRTGGLDGIDLEEVLKENEIGLRDNCAGNGDLLVGYTNHDLAYTAARLYTPKPRAYGDYAYDSLNQWLSDMKRGEAYYGKRLSTSPERSFPYVFAFYEGNPTRRKATKNPRSQRKQVDEMLNSIPEEDRDKRFKIIDEKLIEAWGPYPGKSQTPQDKGIRRMEYASKVTLYRAAAIFYPELPEGAVMSKEEVEYPQIVLEPTNVLARSREEAQARVSGKIKKGFLDRQDGHVQFLIKEF